MKTSQLTHVDTLIITVGTRATMLGDQYQTLRTQTPLPDILQLMNQVLEGVCAPNWTIPEKPLLRSLYEWGLNLLQSETAS